MSLGRLFCASLMRFALSSVPILSTFNPVLTHAAQAPDTIAARVQACAICHGKQGEGVDNDYFPHLSGKPAGYLYNQLKNFRAGRRKYPPMNDLLAYLSDDYLREIAIYYSSLPLHSLPASPTRPRNTPAGISDVQARGKQLALYGDGAQRLPACVACHGPKLNGLQPAIPGLLGLSSDYLKAQLGAWRSGARHAAAPDCMRTIATRLTEADIGAVSAWLSMQPLPRNFAPAPVHSIQLPLECGSMLSVSH